MGEIRENVKRNLGYYLSLNGMSQKDLASMLEVSQAAVTNWIKGKNSPDIEMVAKICEMLHISVMDLFGAETSQSITARERILIQRYREKQEMQPAIDCLLGMCQPYDEDCRQ
ncbi:MAG: helix-turn-helix domain-containing protein [Acutalibacteraceae bacterium]